VEPTGRKTPLPRSPCPAPHPFESHARPSRLPLPHFISPHLCSTPCVQQNRRRRPPRSTRRTEPSPLKLVTLVSSASPRALPDQVSRVLVPSSVLAASSEEPAMVPPRFSALATSPTMFMAGNGLASLFSLPEYFRNRKPGTVASHPLAPASFSPGSHGGRRVLPGSGQCATRSLCLLFVFLFFCFFLLILRVHLRSNDRERPVPLWGQFCLKNPSQISKFAHRP
jgi:hypothetical protein